MSRQELKIKSQDRMITQLARQLRAALDGRSHDEEQIQKMTVQLQKMQSQLKKVPTDYQNFMRFEVPNQWKYGNFYEDVRVEGFKKSTPLYSLPLLSREKN